MFIIDWLEDLGLDSSTTVAIVLTVTMPLCVVVAYLTKAQKGQKMTFDKFHPICPKCGHIDPEGWMMICPVDKTYKVHQVITFDENLNPVR